METVKVGLLHLLVVEPQQLNTPLGLSIAFTYCGCPSKYIKYATGLDPGHTRMILKSKNFVRCKKCFDDPRFGLLLLSILD